MKFEWPSFGLGGKKEENPKTELSPEKEKDKNELLRSLADDDLEKRFPDLSTADSIAEQLKNMQSAESRPLESPAKSDLPSESSDQEKDDLLGSLADDNLEDEMRTSLVPEEVINRANVEINESPKGGVGAEPDEPIISDEERRKISRDLEKQYNNRDDSVEREPEEVNSAKKGRMVKINLADKDFNPAPEDSDKDEKADRFLEGRGRELEAREKYEQARAEYVRALVEFEKSKKGARKPKSKEAGKIEVNLLNPKAVLDEKEETFKENINEYRKECLKVKEQELKDEEKDPDQIKTELQKYAKELVIETTAKEAIEIQNLKHQEQIEAAGENKEWIREYSLKAVEAYRKLGWKGKTALSLGAGGLVMGGIMIGGILGLLAIPTGGAIRAGIRTAGGVGAFFGAEAAMKARQQGRARKEIEALIGNKDFIEALNEKSDDLNKKLFEIYGRQGKEEVVRTLAGAAAGIFVGVVMPKLASELIPDSWKHFAAEKAGSLGDFFKDKVESWGLHPEIALADATNVVESKELKSFAPSSSEIAKVEPFARGNLKPFAPDDLGGFYGSDIETPQPSASAPASVPGAPDLSPETTPVDSAAVSSSVTPESGPAGTAPSAGPEVAAAGSADVVEVKEGDSVWKIVEDRLESSDEFNNLNDAQKTYVIDHFKDQIEADPAKYGLTDAGQINAGDKIDLSEIKMGGDEMNEAIGKAQGLSESQMENIRNYSPEKAIPSAPDNLSASARISEEFKNGQASAATGAAESGNIESGQGTESRVNSALPEQVATNASEKYDKLLNDFVRDNVAEKYPDFNYLDPDQQEYVLDGVKRTVQENMSKHPADMYMFDDVAPGDMQNEIETARAMDSEKIKEIMSFRHDNDLIDSGVGEKMTGPAAPLPENLPGGSNPEVPTQEYDEYGAARRDSFSEKYMGFNYLDPEQQKLVIDFTDPKWRIDHGMTLLDKDQVEEIINNARDVNHEDILGMRKEWGLAQSSAPDNLPVVSGSLAEDQSEYPFMEKETSPVKGLTQEEYEQIINPAKGEYDEKILQHEFEKFHASSEQLPQGGTIEKVVSNEIQRGLTGQENLNSQELAKAMADSKINNLGRQTLQMHSRIISGYVEQLKQLDSNSEQAGIVKRSIKQLIDIDEKAYKNKNLFSKEIKDFIKK